VALLLEATRGQAAASPEDSCHAQALAERLGCLPLALTHAVAYLGYYEIKIGEYLAEFDRNLSDVLRYHDHKAIQYETNPEKESRVKTVATTFFMSFDRLDSVEKAILQAASFLAPDPIPVAMFGECPEQLNKLVHLWCQENGEQAVGKPVRDAVAQLANFSLITRADGTFSMHRMEQAILRNRVPASVKYKWSEATVNLLRGYAPTNPRHPSAWSAWEPLLPHAEFLWNAYRATPGLTISVQLPAAIAQFFLGKGRYKNAIPYARQVLDYHELHSGPEHPDTFISRSTLADLMRRNGEYKAAEPMQRQALEMSERVLGREHTSTLECIHALGILLSYKREYAEAEPLLRRVLEVRERVLGPEHPDTVDSVNELAVMLYKAGRFVEVDPLFRRALEASERVLGPDHPNTLDNLNNLARLRDDQGDYGAADSLFRRALEASERVLGPEHPSTLLYLRNYRLFAAAPLIYVGVLLYNLILPTWRYFDKLADPKRLLVFLIAIALGFAMAIAIRRSSRRSIWGVPTEVLVVGVVFLTAFQIIPRISQAAASANWLSTWFALGCGWGLTITWVQRIRAGLLFRAVLHAFRKRQRQ
jgi:tetratricopeptide (TPR) repeat protein